MERLSEDGCTSAIENMPAVESSKEMKHHCRICERTVKTNRTVTGSFMPTTGVDLACVYPFPAAISTGDHDTDSGEVIFSPQGYSYS